MADFINTVQVIILLGCILPILIVFVLGIAAFYFGKQFVENFVEPDTEKLFAQITEKRQKQPGISDEDLIRQIIRQQAFKCGMVGAITGFGGFVTLPITLPIDMLVTARYQATMVSFIAQVFGYQSSVENKAATYAVMTGSTEMSKITIHIIQQYAPRVIGKSFSKLIPVLGAVIAFIVNYAMARSMAMLAIRWYSTKSRTELIRIPQSTS